MQAAIDAAVGALARTTAEDGRISTTRLDEHQTVAYDLASLASAVAAARHLLGYGERGDHEAALALAYAADVAVDLQSRVAGRTALWGLDADPLTGVADALAAGRDPQLASSIAETVLVNGEAGPRHLGEELEMVRQTFRRFAEDKVVPVAEEVHRHDRDIPESVIAGLAELGCFALSIPEEYGGFSAGGEDELLNMVLVTEELSRGSLGVAGSLITRPEIIGTAILKGGTDQQKQTWLPAIASGEKMCGVAVTEPDHGSDVAGVKVTATRDGDDWIISGVKTWCTFGGRAEYLLVLARTDPDRSLGHRGLSLFVVEKPSFEGHEWRAEQEDGGSMDARAIPTIGYRGMHSFEISFDRWRVPHRNLIGEDDGLGRGFYLQMQAFANARLQTAARALGVMQSALEFATGYAKERHVFDTPLADYGLNRTKIARMAAVIAACRVFATDVARRLARGDADAALGASQLKQLSCRMAEWVTREAQQIHGGYGYAEEYTVSRLFVDARVLSIFEGADEVLALRVIARTLLTDALRA
ncbi:acyl-CoA dehydrogenase family protein [Egicoccus sp. AB-alg6-2]|uniref:acyl-CoA dehydrogenase family protein n=1 Tax=Egicoccus sp. AB-alg6-2 TaxID=3242692 RepID=UPI00359D82C2